MITRGALSGCSVPWKQGKTRRNHQQADGWVVRAPHSSGGCGSDGALAPGERGLTMTCNAVPVPTCASLLVTSMCPGGDLRGGRGQTGSEISELLTQPGSGQGPGT